MQHPIAYLICTTERTGSYVLCDALASTGLAGRPQEALHPASLKRLAGQADKIDYPLAFERIIEEGATPNGVFGAKIQWWQLLQLIQRLRELPEFRGVGAAELLQHWLPGARYIRLTRRDKVRQAVSCLKALQTDIWWETDTWVRAGRAAPAAQPTFDLDAIDRLIQQIGQHEAAWQLLFETCGVQPLELAYEDLAHDHAAVARQVLDFLPLAVPGDLVIGQPRYKKQADELSEQWVRSYHEQKTAKAGPAAAAPVQVSRQNREIIFSQNRSATALPIRPRADHGRALRIVSYATEPLDGLPALLARQIAEHTPHAASCVWGGPPEQAPDGMAAANHAAELVAAADVVLLHDGEVGPQHQALFANKPIVVLAHRPHAQQSHWLRLGAPGAVLGSALAGQAAFAGWPRLQLPWDSARDWDRLWMPLIARALPPPEPHGRVVYRQALPAKQPQEKPQPGPAVKLTAYQLHSHAATLEVATLGQPPAPGAAEAIGWELRCPYGFEASWNGGPRPEDIHIQLDAPEAGTPPFVRSLLGGGRLSFDPGYQIQTEGPTRLWVRGPVNAPKDGLAALEQIANTSAQPASIAITWQFTRAGQAVRFAAGEPFAVLLPYAPGAYGQLEKRVVPHGQALPAAAQSGAAAPQAGPPGRWAAGLSEAPPVSCICPTYGRVALLEEAIESFLRQDYPGPKELIVLNDYPDQTLSFDHPEVRIVNLPRRLHSVGEKYQAAVALCSHDLVFVWNDDDIYLPHRLSLSVALFSQARGFFKASQAWFWNRGQLAPPQTNRFHGGCCFSRALFAETQGYPHTDAGFDAKFEAACEQLRPGIAKGQPLAPADLFYIYRWAGTGSYHLSAFGQKSQPGAAIAAYVRERAERGEIARGPVALKPHWSSDYAALVNDYLANGPSSTPQAKAEPADLPAPTFIDTPEGRVDLRQFEASFYRAAPSTTRELQERIRKNGATHVREFYVVDALRLVYLPVPKSACSSIKIALAKPAGFDYDLSRGTEGIHGHGRWHIERIRLKQAQHGYYRFSFVRNPFDRLVSCYRQKILFTPTPAMPRPFYDPYFFDLPANTSFADFAERVCRIPDALSENHFKSQYALLYDAGKLLVDYVGKLEQVERDWSPLAERFQLEPLLVETNVSRNKPGTHSDYRRYYTAPLARLVYERYRHDVEAFGYQAEYEQLLAFVAEGEPVAAAG